MNSPESEGGGNPQLAHTVAMPAHYRLRLAIAAVIFCAFLVFAYVTGPASLEPGEVPATDVAAAAIDRFGAEFSRQVEPAEKVVLPNSLDVGDVSSALTSDHEIVSEVADGEPHWRVVSVHQVADYWQVEMSSTSGPAGNVFFSGTILFQLDSAGELFRVSPESVGATPTTSTS